ncbi:MAG: class I SAM-dependent methyltransferase [Kiritimatiellia bacterium]
MKPWYEALFANYARKYDEECFTQGTLGECDFIEREIGGDRSRRILDVGCGTGRHAVELAARGYAVVGVDLSEAQLARARAKAAARGIAVDFRPGDARALPFAAEFDLAIMLCEGGFPLMETDEMNFQILQSAARALKPGGLLIFTTLNGLFPLFHSVKDFLNAAAQPGQAATHGNTFDLMTFRDRNVVAIEDDSGQQMELACNERYYVPSEISWLLKTAGFAAPEIFGAKLGAYSRNDPLTADDYEMLVVARKA